MTRQEWLAKVHAQKAARLEKERLKKEERRAACERMKNAEIKKQEKQEKKREQEEEKYFRRKIKWLAKLSDEERKSLELPKISNQHPVFHEVSVYSEPILKPGVCPFAFNRDDIVGYKEWRIVLDGFARDGCISWGRSVQEISYLRSDHHLNRLNIKFFDFWTKRQEEEIQKKRNAADSAAWKRINQKRFKSRKSSKVSEEVFFAGCV